MLRVQGFGFRVLSTPDAQNGSPTPFFYVFVGLGFRV